MSTPGCTYQRGPHTPSLSQACAPNQHPCTHLLPPNMPAACATCDTMPRNHRCVVCMVEEALQHPLETWHQENVPEAVAAPAPSQAPSNPGHNSVGAPVSLGHLALSPQNNGVSRPVGGPDGREEEGDLEASLLEELYDKMAYLLGFLLLKFRSQELITKEEMLRAVLNGDEAHYSLIFSQVCECLQLVFGVDVREVDAQLESYMLVTTLGLTYQGMVGPEQPMPNSGLLVMTLGIILLEDDCASEEDMWGALSLVGVYPGREHLIYGEPRELLTNAWVQEQYLEYQQVPGSDPALYQFLWGPRARAEIHTDHMVDFLVRLYKSARSSFFTMPDVSQIHPQGGGPPDPDSQNPRGRGVSMV